MAKADTGFGILVIVLSLYRLEDHIVRAVYPWLGEHWLITLGIHGEEMFSK